MMDASSSTIVVRELLSKGQPIELRARGLSMLPSIWPGQWLRVVPCNFSDVKVADVVLSVNGSRLLAHRVFSLSPDSTMLTTWGDANKLTDAPTPSSDLLGRVSHHTLFRHHLWVPTSSLYGRAFLSLSFLARPCSCLLGRLMGFLVRHKSIL